MTVAAALNTEGGDSVIGVAEDGAIVGIERDSGFPRSPSRRRVI